MILFPVFLTQEPIFAQKEFQPRRVSNTSSLPSMPILSSTRAVGVGQLNSERVAPDGPEGRLTEVMERVGVGKGGTDSVIEADTEVNAVVSVVDDTTDRRRRRSYPDLTAEAIDVVRGSQNVNLVK